MRCERYGCEAGRSPAAGGGCRMQGGGRARRIQSGGFSRDTGWCSVADGALAGRAAGDGGERRVQGVGGVGLPAGEEVLQEAGRGRIQGGGRGEEEGAGGRFTRG